eukprot:10812184-Alexandrium_andersonii.AAC.1
MRRGTARPGESVFRGGSTHLPLAGGGDHSPTDLAMLAYQQDSAGSAESHPNAPWSSAGGEGIQDRVKRQRRL